jgi:hypothetical protein
MGRKLVLDGMDGPDHPLEVIPSNGHRPALQWAEVPA